MKAVPKKQKNLISQTLSTLLCFGLFVYFSFHLMHGDMGYFALRGVTQKLAEAEERQVSIAADRAKLENRVKLLRSTSLDLDMLDERARVVLGFIGPDELAVLKQGL